MKRFVLILFLSCVAFFLHAQKSLNVYVFIAEECPISIYMANPLKEVVKSYGDEANFYLVFPTKKSNQKTAEQFIVEYGLDEFKILLDKDQSITKNLNGSITPEVVVNNTDGDLLYQGRINNAYSAPGKMKHGKRNNDLKWVMGELACGKSIPKPWHPAVGCFITFRKQG